MNSTPRFSVKTDDFGRLGDGECRALLGTRTFGRVGLTSGGLPAILPVRYSYADDAITFLSCPGTKLRAAADGDVLAFEVDAYDDATDEGWSVLVLGRADVLGPGPETDTGDSGAQWVRLYCEVVTGRRLVPGHAERAAAEPARS